MINNLLKKTAKPLQFQLLKTQKFKNFRQFCTQENITYTKNTELNPDRDLIAEEYSPLQNVFIYNDAPVIKKFVKHSKIIDQDDGSTIFKGIYDNFQYFEDFSYNDSLGIIEDDLIYFSKQNNIPQHALEIDLHENQHDFENTFPKWETFEDLDLPLGEFDKVLQTVSDFTNFEHYGQKFCIIEYEILAFDEKQNGKYEEYMEWVPITILQTEIEGEMVNLTQIEGESQQHMELFKQLLVEKNVFANNMEATEFFKNFSKTKTFKKNFTNSKIETIEKKFVPGSVIKAFKGSYSDIGIYLSPEKVIQVNTDQNSKQKEFVMEKIHKKDNVLEEDYYKKQEEKLKKFEEKQQKKQESSVDGEHHHGYAKRITKKDVEEQEKKQESEGIFGKLKGLMGKSENLDARRQRQAERMQRIREKREQRELKMQQRGDQAARRQSETMRQNNRNSRNRFFTQLLRPSSNYDAYKIVSFKDFVKGASEVRQTTFSYQPYTVDELIERMKKLNKKNPEIRDLYQSYQAYYLAVGFKATPVSSFSQSWYLFKNSVGLQSFIYGVLGLGIVLSLLPEQRNRIFKLGRKYRRQLERYSNMKFELGFKSQEQNQNYDQFRDNESLSQKIKQMQKNSKANEHLKKKDELERDIQEHFGVKQNENNNQQQIS